jgi:hypothetical protein
MEIKQIDINDNDTLAISIIENLRMNNMFVQNKKEKSNWIILGMFNDFNHFVEYKKSFNLK